MLECKLCGCDTVPEKICCLGRSFDCDCNGEPVNDSEDYFCAECLPKYELIMSIESLSNRRQMKGMFYNMDEDLIELFKENKELFK